VWRSAREHVSQARLKCFAVAFTLWPVKAWYSWMRPASRGGYFHGFCWPKFLFFEGAEQIITFQKNNKKTRLFDVLLLN
jgi:hypothetical protein